MPMVGEQLRRARELQGLNIYQVAELTKIKTDHIRALEESNYQAFSAAVYLRGFTRTYASVLKLNVPEIMATLDAELEQIEKFREPPSLIGRSRGFLDFLMLQFSKINARTGLMLAAILLGIALTYWAVSAWRQHQAKDPLSNLGPGLYQPSVTNQSGFLPLPTNAAPRR